MRQINQVPDASGAGYYNPCSGALSIVMPSEAINQVMNPSFELYNSPYTTSAFVGWSLTRRSGGVNTTLTNIETYITAGSPVWSGANALYTANVVGFDFVSLTYSSVNLTQSRNFALSFYIYGASGSHGRTYTTRVVSGATTVAQKSFTLIEGQWQRVELVFFATSTVTATFVIEKASIAGSWAGGNAYIDAVQFEQVSAPDTDIGLSVSNMHASTYFDGDTEGTIDDSTNVYEYAWQGTPHRSRSVRYATTASGGRIYNLQDEFGLEIIGIAEASMSQPQVQAIAFGSQDGGALQDIINPVRTITLVGQLSGADKIELARKVQRLTALLSRDLLLNRQDRTFIFQHLDGRDPIGVPLTFRGAFAGGLNVFTTNALTVNVDIAIQMHDPYFYGHDESLRLGPNVAGTFSSNTITKVSQFDTDAKTRMLETVATGLNGPVLTIAQAPDGRIWIGGNFTQSGTGQSLAYICIYNPITDTFSAVPGGTLNGLVTIIKFDASGLAWIGGSFTGIMGNYLTTHNGSAYVNTGNFNNSVLDIEIVTAGNEQQIFAVGQFTIAPSVAANRIARYRTSTASWGAFSVGFNSAVFAITYNPLADLLYVGGSFTTTAPGTNTGRIAQINRATAAITGLDLGGVLNGPVRDIYVDADGTVVFGGEFIGVPQYLAYIRDGVITQFPGFAQIGSPSGIFPLQNSICTYKGGIFVGAPSYIRNIPLSADTYGPSMSYWNGTVLGGSSWIPIAGAQSTSIYSATVLSDGTLMLGAFSPLGEESGTVTHTTNSSTIQAYPTIRMIFGDNPVQVSAIVNVRDDKLMIFTDQAPVGQLDQNFINRDLVTIKPKYGTIMSMRTGNAISVLNLAGAFADYTLRPGVVSMAMIMSTLTSASQIDVYWRQTFQSIFDGVNKS